jgi:predicted Kef-type K+ transport protein
MGAGVAAASAGMSMALGAFIAGLLLAETEFRREVEVTIELHHATRVIVVVSLRHLLDEALQVVKRLVTKWLALSDCVGLHGDAHVVEVF